MKNITKHFLALTFALTFLCLLPSFAQPGDSLYAVVDTATNERKVKALNELFRAHLQSDPIKAIGFTREALMLATEINDQKGLAASYNNLGVAYRSQGALDKALEYYLNSLKIYESLDHKEGIATTKNNISTIYSMKKDYEPALKYLEDSHNMFLNLNDEEKIIGSMNNLGTLHIEMEVFDKALSYLTKAQERATKSGKENTDIIANLGNLYFKQGNYQRAIEQYEEALKFEVDKNNKLGTLAILTNLGITHTKAKQSKPAQQNLEQARALCDELQAYSYLPAILRATSENYAVQNKWKEAYELQLKYDEAREKIYGEESTRNIAQMEMILDFHEKEKEYDLLKVDDEIKTLQLHNTRLIIVMIILGSLILLGTLNFIFMSRKKSYRQKPSVS